MKHITDPRNLSDVKMSENKNKEEPLSSVIQLELCSCLNGEVMIADFYVLPSRGMIQIVRC